jgi:predicted methyltransferase
MHPLASWPLRSGLAAALLGGNLAAHAQSAAPQATRQAEDPALAAAVAGPQRTPAYVARDRWRHPAETLQFLGLRPDQQVLELAPGGGWYTEILAPYLREHGRLYVAHYALDANDPVPERQQSRRAFEAKLAASPDVYDRVVVGTLPVSAFTDLRFDRPLDAVLTFRNLHNWVEDGHLAERLKLFYSVLKPGGVLGVEEHRAAPGTPLRQQIATGYLTEAFVIEQARAAGFQLAGRSEVNANPSDTKDHPQGVWSLLPTLRGAPASSPERERALAIGESDRMTLRFVKPRS